MIPSRFFLLLLIGLMAVTGCTTLYSQGPVAIVESPQNSSIDRDSKESQINLGTLPSQYFNLSDNVAQRPLVARETPDLKEGRTFDFGLRKPFFNRLELGISGFPVLSNSLSGQIIGMAKYQVFGQGHDQLNQEPFDLSVFGHLVFTEISIGGNQERLFGPGGYPWNAESHFQGFSAGVSLGKSLSRNLYIYSGLARQEFQINAKVSQGPTDSGSYPSATYELPQSSGFSENWLSGISFGVKNQVNIVFNFSRTLWKDLTLNAQGLNINFVFYELGKPKKTISPVKN